MITTDQLKQLARTVEATRIGPALLEPGQPVSVKLLKPSWELNAFDILSLSDKIPSFTIPSISVPPVTIPEVTVPEIQLPPVPMNIPIRIEVKWKVIGEDGTELLPLVQKKTKVPISIAKIGHAEPEADFVALDGLNAVTEASFLFIPQLVELTNEKRLPRPIQRIIVPTVNLIANIPNSNGIFTDVQSGWIELPPIQVSIQALGIPTVLALFRHTDFQAWSLDNDPGAVLVIVPGNSLFKRLEEIMEYLDLLSRLMEQLSFFPKFAFFLLGIETLANALAAQPNATFRSLDEIANLNKIKMISVKTPWRTNLIPNPNSLPTMTGRFRSGDWPSVKVGWSTPWRKFMGSGIAIPGTDIGNDIEAEDIMSSLILVGPPPRVSLSTPDKKTYRVVECYNNRNYKNNEGQMNVKVGSEMSVIIRNLHWIRNSNTEYSNPGSRVDVVKNSTSSDGFGNELSSIRFKLQPSSTSTGPARTRRGRIR